MLFHGGGPPPTGVTTFTHGIIYYCARYESLPHAVATVRRTDLFRIVGHCYRVFFSFRHYVLSTSNIGHRSTSCQKRYSSSSVVAILVYYRRHSRKSLQFHRGCFFPYRNHLTHACRFEPRRSVKDGTRTHQHARVREALSYFIEHVARVCPLSRGQAIGIPRVSTRRSDIVGWRDLERERRSIAFSRVTRPLEACCDVS